MKIIPAAFLFFIFLNLSTAYAAAPADSGAITARLERIEQSLKEIQADQKKSIQKQQEIVEKLDQLRVWVRRS